MIEKIKPKSREHWLELRTQDVTSTECPALFGLSPYQTVFELWHNKKNQQVVELEDTERMAWGRRFEMPIAHAIANEHGLEIEKMDDYLRDPIKRIGSSFDYSVMQELDCHVVARDGKEFEETLILPRGILEIKNVDQWVFKNQWVVESGTLMEAPPHIEIQVQHQLLVSNRDFAYIGVLVGGNKLYTLRRYRNENICSRIEKAAELFWESIYNDKPPAPDFKRDAEFIASIYDYAEPGKIKDASEFEGLEQLIEDYKQASKIAKEAESAKQQAKAQLLMKIGDTEKVVGQGFSISAGMIGEAEVSYTRKAYRNFRVNFSRKKEGSND